jgi:hypothetical protein
VQKVQINLGQLIVLNCYYQMNVLENLRNCNVFIVQFSFGCYRRSVISVSFFPRSLCTSPLSSGSAILVYALDYIMSLRSLFSSVSSFFLFILYVVLISSFKRRSPCMDVYRTYRYRTRTVCHSKGRYTMQISGEPFPDSPRGCTC